MRNTQRHSGASSAARAWAVRKDGSEGKNEGEGEGEAEVGVGVRARVDASRGKKQNDEALHASMATPLHKSTR
eukprot:875099-Pleurochrysis_carterae.AAC.3